MCKEGDHDLEPETNTSGCYSENVLPRSRDLDAILFYARRSHAIFKEAFSIDALRACVYVVSSAL